MKSLFLFFGALSVGLQFVSAQEHMVKTYTSLEAYRNGDGKDGGKYWNFNWSVREFFLITKKNGKEGKVRMDGVWGFTVDSALYRVDHNTPYRVDVVTSDMILYIHGISYLNYMGERADRPNLHDNYKYNRYHVSVDLNSEIFVIFSGKAKKAFEGNEKASVALKCAKWKMGTPNDGTRECITDNLEETSILK